MAAIKPLKVNTTTGDYADFQSGDYLAPAQGGLGTSTAPSSVGQIPIATSSNLYTAANITASTNQGVINTSGGIMLFSIDPVTCNFAGAV